ncbi:MAG: hypothetical protein BWY29_00665 [Microgenomates group bacterium ADurb.Bin238]|nr:MAG: hypothetical protein BWY29_00665 [Microgenomates group bacterium ADurb.Bin238]
MSERHIVFIELYANYTQFRIIVQQALEKKQ